MAERRNDIQWLRALAALEVVLVHSDLIVKHFSPHRLVEAPWYQPLAGVGVELFFVVSGYIMCMRVPVTAGYRAFIASRVTRIFPLYWILTSVVVVVANVVPEWRLGFKPDLATIARAYLILPGWAFPILGPGWTLEYELVFYALVALLMAFGVKRGRGMLAFGWALAGLGLLGCLRGPLEEGSALLFHMASPYMFAFGAGWMFRCLEGEPVPVRVRSLALFAGMAGAAAWLSPEWGDRLVVRIAVAALVFGSVVALRRVFAAPTLPNRAMWRIGDASYSLYLVHWFVLSAAGKAAGAMGVPAALDWPLRIVGCLLCVAAGLASYRWLEKPSERALRRAEPGRLYALGRRRAVPAGGGPPAPG